MPNAFDIAERELSDGNTSVAENPWDTAEHSYRNPFDVAIESRIDSAKPDVYEKLKLESGGKSPFDAGTEFVTEVASNIQFDAGNLARATVADVAAGMSLLKRPDNQPLTTFPSPTAMVSAIKQNLPAAAEASGNIPAALNRKPLPIDAVIESSALEARDRGEFPIEATVAHISQGIAETAPMLAVIGGLPGLAQKAALVAFTGDMIKRAPEVATELGAELGKPKEEQDPNKISKLTSDAIQIVGFTAAGALGIAKGIKEVTALKKAGAPQTAAFVEEISKSEPATTEATSEIRVKTSDAEVLQDEKSTVGLRESDAGNAQLEIAAATQTEAQKAAQGTAPEITSPNAIPSEAETAPGPLKPTAQVPEETASVPPVASETAPPLPVEEAKPPIIPTDKVDGTSLKNAVADLERASLGMPDATPTERQAMAPAWIRAGETLANDSTAGQRLIARIATDPKQTLTNDEMALALRHKVGVFKALNDAAERTISGTSEEKAAARIEVARLSDEFETLMDAIKAEVSHAGRRLRWQQAMAYEDYSFATQERLLRAAKGGERLTDSEHSKLVQDLADHKAKVAEMQAASDKKAEDAVKEALDRVAKEAKEQPLYHPTIINAAERIVKGFEARAAKAVIRLREKMSRVSSGVDPTIIFDLAEIGVAKLGRKIVEFAKWADAVRAEVGPEFSSKIEPYLKDAHAMASEILESDLAKVKGPTAEKVKRAVKGMDVAEQTADTISDIKAKVESGKLDEINPLVQKLARLAVEKGARGWREITDAVHAQLKEIIPDLDYRDTMEAFSNHGKFSMPRQDVVSKEVSDAKSQVNEILKIQEVIARKPVKPTGFQRGSPTDAKRRLTQIYENVKRKFGIKVENPEVQLRSALQARKTYYQNRLTDLKYEIEKGQRTVKSKSPSPTDAALETLKAEYAKVKAEHDEIFQKPGLTDEQRLALAEKSATRQIAELERQLKTGEIFPAGKKPFTGTSPELEAAKAKIEALKAERDWARDLVQPKPQPLDVEEQRRSESLDKQIEDIESQIRDESVFPKGKTERIETPENKARLDRLEELKQQRQFIRERLQPKPERDPEAIALAAKKAALTRRIAELTDKLARGDFSPRAKRPGPVLDNPTMKLEVEKLRIEQRFADARRSAELRQRSMPQKIVEFFTKWLRREFVLSSPTSIAKLTAAAIEGLTFEPIKEAVGKVVSTVLPRFGERTQVERSSSIKIEANAFKQAFMRSMDDAIQTLKTGKSDLEMAFGGRKAVPEEMVSYFGRLHGALKTPLKRAAFERVFSKLAEQNISKGVDVSEPLMQMQMGTIAMREANRMLFLEDNRMVQAYQRALSRFSQVDKETGKVSAPDYLIGGGLRLALPIVRIPTNLVARTIQAAVGFPVGATKLAVAYAKGIEKLPADQADLIMRQLKQGSIGGAFLLFGYFMPEIAGGYYQPGEKRDPKDAKVASLKIGDYNVPSFLLHHPILEVMQLGATIRRVSDSKLRKKDAEEQGLTDGVKAGLIGLTEETPFVREIFDVSKVHDPHQRDQFLNSEAASIVNPQFVSWMARQIDKPTPFSPFEDTTKRKPVGLMENIEMGIPGLRQNVPEKK